MLRRVLAGLMIASVTTTAVAYASPSPGNCDPSWQSLYDRGFALRSGATNDCLESCLEQKRYFYEQAVSACPSDPAAVKAHVSLGEVLRFLGRFADARAQYEAALRVDAANAVAAYGLGELAMDRSDYLAAADYMERARAGHGLPEVYASWALDRLQLARQLAGSGEIRDAETMKKVLGGKRIVVMGVAGVAPTKKLPLRIAFDFDRDEPNSDGRKVVEELGRALHDIQRDDPQAAFLIVGNTDERGTDDYNYGLSRRRARAVARVLTSREGIAANSLATKGYGSTRLQIKSAQTEEEHAINRRVEVIRYTGSELDARCENGLAERLDSESPVSKGTAGRKVAVAATAPLELTVDIYRENDEGEREKLPVGAALRSGELYSIGIVPSRDCYIYAVQSDSHGALQALSPNLAFHATQKRATARRQTWLPSAGGNYKLGDKPGDETIYVLASLDPRQDVEDILERYGSRSAHTDLGAVPDETGQQELHKVIKPMGVEIRSPALGAGVAPARVVESRSENESNAVRQVDRDLPSPEVLADRMTVARVMRLQHL